MAINKTTVMQLDKVQVAQGQKLLINPLNISFECGRFIAIVGENGCGKSTLLDIISGHKPVQQGRVLFQQQPLNQWPSDALAKQRAVLQQSPPTPFGFLAVDVLMMGRLLAMESNDTSIEIVSNIAEQLQISHLLERKIQTLSGGEKQRVFFAKSLLQLLPDGAALSSSIDLSGKLLLLDEPTSALDFRYQKTIVQALKDLTELGLTVICVSHDINLVSPYCHKMLMLGQQSCIAYDTPEQVITETNLQRCFNTEVQLLTRDGQTPFIYH